MGRGEHALLHQVYPTEVHGDTAVLRPRGDAAGFTLHTVSTELAHVRELIQSGRVKNLLVDLGYHRYFGSMVIGDLLQLAQLVRSNGGRTGLCGVSHDMESVLRLFQLEDQWEQFDSCPAAINSLANIPVHQKVRRLVVPGLAAAACLTLFLVFWFYPRPDYAVVYHEKLDKLWDEVSKKRQVMGIDEWPIVAQRTESQLSPIIDRLERKVKTHRAKSGEKYMLLAIKYHWLPWLKDQPGFDENRNRQLTEYYLGMAKAKSLNVAPPTQPELLYASAGPPDLMEPGLLSGDTSTSSGYTPPADSTLDGAATASALPDNTPPVDDMPPVDATRPETMLVVPVSGSTDREADIAAPSDGSQSTETPRSI